MRAALTLAEKELAAVVLAAGGSTRLGRPKQLLRYRGRPLLLNAVDLAESVAGAGVIVVLGDEQLRLRSLLNRHRRGVTVVSNPGWREGLASSLRAGVRAVPRKAAGALILLVDQPRLETFDLAKLARAWGRHPRLPAAAWYLERAGAPAIIPRRWFGEMTALSGDVGARQLLRGIGRVSLVNMPAAEFDVDTPADAESLGS
ncbi:MAG: nucleotidyltransferase family protein [Gammaproteobacteria bacterium]|jgi:molybdenum cofactor cytidylyltransferase